MRGPARGMARTMPTPVNRHPGTAFLMHPPQWYTEPRQRGTVAPPLGTGARATTLPQ